MSCTNCPAREILNTTDVANSESCGKLDTYDWLSDIPEALGHSQLLEVRFKNTRKEFILNKDNYAIKRGDYVTVSSDFGHDIGQITLSGMLAEKQLKIKNPKEVPTKIVFRKSNKSDLEKWQMARLREKPTMLRARVIAKDLGLEMKISDVEFQGDGRKAIFYYIAEGRVDFRELIKKYAKEFNVKIEMKQIGARQEAARVGGIGSCGKELCCSSWRTNLESVSSTAARIQELPHNLQKLTGQCGKLKCCLMYELDQYLEAKEEFFELLLELETDKGIAKPVKKDLLARIIYYQLSEEPGAKQVPVGIDRVKEIIMLNKKGIKVESLSGTDAIIKEETKFTSFENDLASFTKKSTANKKKKNNNFKRRKKKNFKGKSGTK